MTLSETTNPTSAITIDYEHNNIQDVGLESNDLFTNLVTFGSRMALNPRIQFSAFINTMILINKGAGM